MNNIEFVNSKGLWVPHEKFLDVSMRSPLLSFLMFENQHTF